MHQDSRLASRLLRRIEARNHELMTEMAIEAGMGILFTALAAGVLFCTVWFVCAAIGGRAFPTTAVALGITGLYVVVSAISAWRHVDPFAGLAPMSDGDRLAFAVSGYGYFKGHSVAGLAAVLMGGPLNLVSALRTWLHRLPTDPTLVAQAAEILGNCRPEVDLTKVSSSASAAILLRRLNLIVPRVDTTLVTLTERGRDVVGQNRTSPGLE